jgi:hypothetical protein
MHFLPKSALVVEKKLAAEGPNIDDFIENQYNRSL